MSLPWIVELVFPPGIFVARQLTEPKSREELDAEMFESMCALPLFSDRFSKPSHLPESTQPSADPEPRHRWTLLHFPSGFGQVAQLYSEILARTIPDPSPPWTASDLEAVTKVLEPLGKRKQ